MTTKVKNKENDPIYNVKVNEEGDIHKVTPEEYKKIVKQGKDSKGKFAPNNRFGELQKEKRSAKERMGKNFRKGEEIEVLRNLLLNSKNENVRLQAAKLILEYKHGRPTQVIEQETFNHNDVEDYPEEVKNLLDSLDNKNEK